MAFQPEAAQVAIFTASDRAGLPLLLLFTLTQPQLGVRLPWWGLLWTPMVVSFLPVLLCVPRSFSHAAMSKTRPIRPTDQPGLQAADWPRTAEACWGCPGPESAAASACWRRACGQTERRTPCFYRRHAGLATLFDLAMSVHKSVASVAGLLQLRSSYAWTVTSKLGGTVLGGVDSKACSKAVLAQGAATPPDHAMSKWQRRVARYGRSSCAQLAAAPKCRLHARELAIGGWLLLHAALLHRVSRAIGFSVYFGGAGATLR